MSPVRHGSDRFEQERIGRPTADRIYRTVYGFDAVVERPERGGALDRLFAIDAIVRPATGLPVTLQEKFLSCEYARYQSVTIEYMQDGRAEQGDWFNLACQLYFVGYLNDTEDAFDPWALVDLARLSAATAQGRVRWSSNENKDGRARASFRYIRMASIPGDCIVAGDFPEGRWASVR